MNELAGYHPQAEKYKVVGALCLVPVLLVAGCGRSGPEVAPVSGRVTLDGQPLEMVDVVFQPKNGDSPSTSRTGPDGRYELLYKRGIVGARTGEHVVHIGFTSNIVKNPPNIPARYNTNSDLLVEVKPGSNEYNFDLKNAGK